MTKSLVIVESPAKARTLGKYLGKDFRIEATKGHIRDLPEKRFGVDLKNGFKPEYQVLSGREKTVAHLKKAAAAADKIYLAPDPDREGEAIAWHMSELLEAEDKCFRATFNEVTKKAVLRAIENPGRLNQSLVDAQQARRILDRLVGYKISPLLGRQFRRWGLSAGRVQSVAVRLIVEREREIRAFNPEEYWSLEAEARASQPPPFSIKLALIKGKKAEIKDGETAHAIVKAVSGKPFVVSGIDKRDVRRKPPAPFITSTLQQEAARKLRMTTSRTMSIAQKLYEGIEVGAEGSIGLITYMRTDSVRLSREAVDAARTYIGETYGSKFVPATAPQYKSGKAAQEAHEAIRPTDLAWTPDQVAKFLSKDEMALYRLIWNRFMASQMSPAVLEQTRVETTPDGGTHVFAATGQVMQFQGFLALYEEGKDEEENPENGKPSPSGDNDTNQLPSMSVGETLNVKEVIPSQHFTKPPSRFNEATLVRELERLGIGRPSTYSSIISTIQNKKYVVKDKGRFTPSETGEVVTDVLIRSFPDIMDVNFTAHMETELDEVEQGKRDWKQVLNEFYEKFAVRLKDAEEHIREVKREAKPTDFDCPECGQKMNLRIGPYGRYLACSAYPECKATLDVEVGEDGEIRPVPKTHLAEEVKCESCGRDMVLKTGRRGPFLSCSGYPECRNTMNVMVCEGGLLRPAKPIGEQAVNRKTDSDASTSADGTATDPTKRTSSGATPTNYTCEDCGRPMVARRGRFGPFLACTGYPTCKGIRKITRDMNITLPPPPPKKQAVPTDVNCTECGKHMVIRTSRRGPFLGCSGFPKCKSTQTLPDHLKEQVDTEKEKKENDE